ncbi:MAG TPA: Hsp33 family molecular chaperone HslO [Spirochaetales bacterium]|nr:Hsp33 family molecular chaperone HslO [Spirochaetales bacterium]
MIQKPLDDRQIGDTKALTVEDKLYPFILEGVNLRGVIVYGTRMVLSMRANHELGPLETLLLGHAYLGAALVSASMKGKDRMRLLVECNGPARGASVEANALGDVRGYLLHNPIDLEEAPLDDYHLENLWGAGTLTLTRYPEGSRTGFTGKVELEKGSLAMNLARYYLRSEQTPTAFVLSIKFDRFGKVLGAGGLFLQTLPGADPQVLEEVENRLVSMQSVGSALMEGKKPEVFLEENFGKFFPRLLESRQVRFFCPCSAGRFSGFLQALPLNDLEDIASEGPFPLRTTCHNCNTTYEFSREEILRLLRNRLRREAASSPDHPREDTDAAG